MVRRPGVSAGSGCCSKPRGPGGWRPLEFSPCWRLGSLHETWPSGSPAPTRRQRPRALEASSSLADGCLAGSSERRWGDTSCSLSSGDSVPRPTHLQTLSLAGQNFEDINIQPKTDSHQWPGQRRASGTFSLGCVIMGGSTPEAPRVNFGELSRIARPALSPECPGSGCTGREGPTLSPGTSPHQRQQGETQGARWLRGDTGVSPALQCSLLSVGQGKARLPVHWPARVTARGATSPWCPNEAVETSLFICRLPTSLTFSFVIRSKLGPF